MPSTYAHFRFGKDVRAGLNGCAPLDAYPELFQIGLHGPDILFYYHPLTPNPIRSTGSAMHQLSGFTVFSEMNQKLLRLPKEHRTAATAYLYGFLCHFALDSVCHGYVQQAIDETGVPHTEIEGELDRLLMVKDGIDPISHPLTGHIVPTLANASVISRFFDGISASQIQKALKAMIAFNDLFLCPGPAKRKALLAGMRLIGQYEGLHGMVINPVPNPACAEAVAHLSALYEDALPLAARLIEGFEAGDGLRDAAYCLNFESQIP